MVTHRSGRHGGQDLMVDKRLELHSIMWFALKSPLEIKVALLLRTLYLYVFNRFFFRWKIFLGILNYFIIKNHILLNSTHIYNVMVVVEPT